MKYELIKSDMEGLYRIRALRDFSDVKKGDIGGYVESEHNLSHDGNAWVYGDARVFGNASVSGNAMVYDNAAVYGNAWVYDNARVFDSARVSGNAGVSGNAWVTNNAEVSNIADYIVFKNWWSSGRHFTWTRSNNLWRVGCFLGTGEELIKKAYNDSEQSGREYERIVKHVEDIIKEEKK